MKAGAVVTLTIFCLLIGKMDSAFSQIKNHPKKDYVVTISTEFGDMVLILYDKTPKHKENFIKLAEDGFYDGTTFHRVINNFMIQGGDPNTKLESTMNKAGQGGPGYTVPAEFVSAYSHKKGALAAARQSDRVNPDKASSGSQFYIVQDERGCKHLNGAYTVYGQVIQGLDVVDTIASQPVNPRKGNQPVSEIKVNMKVDYLKKKKIKKQYGYAYDES